MQCSLKAYHQFHSRLDEFHQLWLKLNREQLKLRLDLPETESMVCVSVEQNGQETVLEICDDNWDQLLSDFEGEEDEFHMGVQASRRILWRPFDKEQEPVALFSDPSCQIFINDLHCGLLEVRPDLSWVRETDWIVSELNQLLQTSIPEIGDQQWLNAEKQEEGSYRCTVSEGAVRVEGPACMISDELSQQLQSLSHSRETAQLDVVSLIDPFFSEHGSAVSFRMLVLVCSNRHQVHFEFQFRKREDLVSALVEGLREFILQAGIPARLQLNRGLYQFILADLAQKLDIRLTRVEHLILTEQLTEELSAALGSISTQR